MKPTGGNNAMNWTILGADGFIGSYLSRFFTEKGYEVKSAGRHFDIRNQEDLGHVIFAIGLTSDFRTRPLETVDAHVCALKSLLAANNFKSLLYLSSTRLYANSECTSEITPLQVNPADPSDLYNLSKLMGESLCFTGTEKPARVARLSNIVGPQSKGDFLSDLVRQACNEGHVQLKTTNESEKDFLFIDSLGPLIENIVCKGRHKIYNVASGTNTSNQQIVTLLQTRFNCSFETARDAMKWSFRRIDISRIQNEFSFAAPPFEQQFLSMLSHIRTKSP